jgi:hypothetical protein
MSALKESGMTVTIASLAFDCADTSAVMHLDVIASDLTAEIARLVEFGVTRVFSSPTTNRPSEPLREPRSVSKCTEFGDGSLRVFVRFDV